MKAWETTASVDAWSPGSVRADRRRPISDPLSTAPADGGRKTVETALESALPTAFFFLIFPVRALNILLSTASKESSEGHVRRRVPGRSDGGRPSPERDLHLVERARRGDRDAFQQLVIAYQERIVRVIQGMVRNPEDARDLAQDVFIKAFGSLDRFRGQSSFYTWLYRIAVNISIDFKRKQARRKDSSFDEHLDQQSAEGVDLPDSTTYAPDRLLEEERLGTSIREAMNQLPEDKRAVIVLRELEGLSYKEIAEVVGCSQGTVMSRLFYARKKLQELLREHYR